MHGASGGPRKIVKQCRVGRCEHPLLAKLAFIAVTTVFTVSERLWHDFLSITGLIMMTNIGA